MIKITWKGTEETKAFLAHAPEALREAVNKSLKQSAVLTKEEAVQNCPVDTGYLRSTIFYRVADFSFSVGAKAGYAGYQEWGTSKMKAQPYLRPAFIFVTQNIPSAMSAEIMREIRRL